MTEDRHETFVDEWGWRITRQDGMYRFERNGSFLAGVLAAVAGLVAFIVLSNSAIFFVARDPELQRAAPWLVVPGLLMAGVTVWLARRAAWAGREPELLATFDPGLAEVRLADGDLRVPAKDARIETRRNYFYRGIGVRTYLVARVGARTVRIGGMSEPIAAHRLAERIRAELGMGA